MRYIDLYIDDEFVKREWEYYENSQLRRYTSPDRQLGYLETEYDTDGSLLHVDILYTLSVSFYKDENIHTHSISNDLYPYSSIDEIFQVYGLPMYGKLYDALVSVEFAYPEYGGYTNTMNRATCFGRMNHPTHLLIMVTYIQNMTKEI